MANPTSSSFSSFTNEWSYDVFLSFRGEDTRTGFTGHLYHTLCEKGFNTFMDDHGLRKGEEITPSLMKAIEEARIAIVIFSENYASSAFCLQELVKIMECFKDKKERLVLPVFYKVEPSDVRHQKGSYAEALTKHETRTSDKNKVEKWRLALQEAADLSGIHFKQGLEYDVIQEIIQDVSKRINRNLLYVAKYPVGLESRVQKVKSLLDVESNDGVHMVGIYGIGGIGKTTLACAVYNFVADQFEGLSFLLDVRQNSKKHGLVQLQERLLSDILREKDFKLSNIKEGIPQIKRKLCKKKILLILDDVDNLEQLEHLAGGLDWFGIGSRVIVTTRDIHLLRSHGVDKNYEVEGLNDEEALELFSWHASRRKQVDSSYLDIPKRVVGYSNGLPLSLEIIGSALIGKPLSVWMSALDSYEKSPHENMQERLRVSYDGLEDLEKQIFLDLACFFRGFELTCVKDVLRSCYAIGTDYAIDVLVDKCLIKIVHDHVRMHNLIEDMGREIVLQESPSKPCERSRLWFYKDIVRVLKESKGSDKIQMITLLDLPKDKEVQWDGNALMKMENLKILVVKNARFSRGPIALPKSLRVLTWHGYPESSLPAEFVPKKLVILDLSDSSFTFKNQLNMKLKSLTKLILCGCKSLKEVPDLSEISNLKLLCLDYCRNLVEVHDSVGFLDKLEWLSLDNCARLRVLPRGMNLPSLKIISLQRCTSLKSFPEILGKMENIGSLDLSGSGINGLPFSIGNLVGLTRLVIIGCRRLRELPSSIFMLPKLTHLVADNCRLIQVRKEEDQDQETMSSNSRLASFSDCYLTDKFVRTLVPCMHYVTDLFLDNSNITILPSSFSACPLLRNLSLNYCSKLREIRGLPPNIQYLYAFDCPSLTSNSKEMLLNQTLHEAGGRHFIIPGSTIPTWFNLKTRGRSLSFWFRNKFPTINLCVVGYFHVYVHCELDMFHNGLPQSRKITLSNPRLQSVKTHTILYELRHVFEESKSGGHTHIENEWYGVEISFENDETINGGIECIGVHVPQQRTNMADIQFKNPDLSKLQNQWKIRLNATMKGPSPCTARILRMLDKMTINNNILSRLHT